MTAETECGAAAPDEVIAAIRLALCRLDLDASGGDIRIGQGTIWYLCDLAAGALARAAQAASYLTPEARAHCDAMPVLMGWWRDQVRGELQGYLEAATLAALDPGQPAEPAAASPAELPDAAGTPPDDPAVRSGRITAVRLALAGLTGEEFRDDIDVHAVVALVRMLLNALRYTGMALGILTEEQKQALGDVRWPFDPAGWPGPDPDLYARAELDRSLLSLMDPGD